MRHDENMLVTIVYYVPLLLSKESNDYYNIIVIPIFCLTCMHNVMFLLEMEHLRHACTSTFHAIENRISHA